MIVELTMKALPDQWSVLESSCFKRSVEKTRLRYTTYIGDRDSSSYNSVVKANPYPGDDIGKEERVGHVQKRVGTLGLNLKKRWGNKA